MGWQKMAGLMASLTQWPWKFRPPGLGSLVYSRVSKEDWTRLSNWITTERSENVCSFIIASSKYLLIKREGVKLYRTLLSHQISLKWPSRTSSVMRQIKTMCHLSKHEIFLTQTEGYSETGITVKPIKTYSPEKRLRRNDYSLQEL